MDQDRKNAVKAFHEMTFSQKAGHILRYHWWKILLVILLIIAAVDYIGHLTFAREKESCMGIALHARYLDPEAIDGLPGHLNEVYAVYTAGGEKEFKVYQFYNGYTAAEAEENTATIYRMAASIQTQMLDVFIGDEESLDFDAGSGYLLDLREVFSEEELALIEEKANALSKDKESGLIRRDVSVTSDTGRIVSTEKDIPLLICVRGADSTIDESLALRPAYIGIVSNAPNLDNVKAFILELLGITNIS